MTSDEVMKLSKDFIPQSLLRQLHERFDSADGVRIVEWLLSDERAQTLFSEAPPFLGDLLRYDLAKATVVRSYAEARLRYLPRGTRLAHDAFRIIDLGYDVPAFDEKKTQAGPAPKKMKLVISATADSPYFRALSIDEIGEAFLFAQSVDPQWWKGELPSAYAEMVEVGLCLETRAN